jgi:hypothetical protein
MLPALFKIAVRTSNVPAGFSYVIFTLLHLWCPHILVALAALLAMSRRCWLIIKSFMILHNPFRQMPE